MVEVVLLLIPTYTFIIYFDVAFLHNNLLLVKLLLYEEK
jgi:hypothetical protein